MRAFAWMGISGLAVVAGCAVLSPQTPSDAGAGYINDLSAGLTEVASRAGKIPFPGSVVGAVRAEGGSAAMLPTEDGGFVAWLDLPAGNACQGALPTGYYSANIDNDAQTARVTLSAVDGSAGLVGLTSPVTAIDDNAPVQLMAAISFGPDSVALTNWHTCSDGSGRHCAWVLTLTGSTPGCG